MYKVRLARRTDIAAMYAIYRPYAEETTFSFEYGAPPMSEFEERIAALSRFPVLVCEEAGETVGFAYAAPAFERRAYAWCAELSVYVRADRRGRGAGSLLERGVSLLLARLGYRKLYALVTEGNEASLAFHKKAGYAERAFFPDQGYKMGMWLGVYWLEKELCGAACCARFPLPLCAADAQAVLEEIGDGRVL